MEYEEVRLSIWDNIVDAAHCDLPGAEKKSLIVFPEFEYPFNKDRPNCNAELTTPVPIAGKADHATFIAGLIAAQINNFGIAGVNPNALIWNYPIKRDIEYNNRQFRNPISKFRDSSNWDTDIVNISQTVHNDLGVSKEFKKMFSEQQNWQHDILFVAAAGNDGKYINESSDCEVVPACEAIRKHGNGILSVVALSAAGDDLLRCGHLREDEREKFEPCRPAQSGAAADLDKQAATNWGPSFEVAAIGATVSTLSENRFGRMAGTSVAAPYATGLASIILAKLRKQLREEGSPTTRTDPRVLDLRISATADPMAIGKRPFARFGRINFERALKFRTDIIVNASGEHSTTISREDNETLPIAQAYLQDGDEVIKKETRSLLISNIVHLRREPNASSKFRVIYLDKERDSLRIYRDVQFEPTAKLREEDSNETFSLADIKEFTACSFYKGCPLTSGW